MITSDGIVSNKLVYISHPIAGDKEENINKVLKICRDVHMQNDGVIPFAPYITTLAYLNDDIPKEREMGIDADREIFYRNIVDELWICGDHISEGMREEIAMAESAEIPIVFHNEELENSF